MHQNKEKYYIMETKKVYESPNVDTLEIRSGGVLLTSTQNEVDGFYDPQAGLGDIIWS